jgi:O-antigen/teichoic acid export membrane protein
MKEVIVKLRKSIIPPILFRLNFKVMIKNLLHIRIHQIVLLSIGAGILNFGFQILLARKLSVNNFGYFSAIWSAIAVVGLFTIGFQNQAIIATRRGQEFSPRTNQRLSYLQSIILLTSILAPILYAVSTLYGNELNQYISGSIAVSLSLPLSALTSVAFGRLIAWRGPVLYLGISFLLALSKILLAVIILNYTDSIDILIFALLAKQAIFTLVFIGIENRFLPKLQGKIYSFASLRVLLPTTIFWMLLYIDVTLIRQHSNATEAGVYAGLSNIAKIPLILSASVNSFLLASKRLDTSNSKLKMFTVKSALCYTFSYFAFLAIIGIFGDVIVQMSIGISYVNQVILIQQVLCYSTIVAFGFLLTFRYEQITLQKLYILSALVIFELSILFFAKLSVPQFLFIYFVFPLAMCITLLLRLVPRASVEKNEKFSL